MADILTSATGVAGLLTLAIEVFQISKVYIESVYKASKTVDKFLRELRCLKQVLWELDDLYSSGEQDDQATLPLEHDQRECEQSLKELRDRLLSRASGNPCLVKLKMMTWPFSENKTTELMERLHRHLQIFQASVNINTNHIVRATQKSIQDLQYERRSEKFQSMLNWLSDMVVQQKQHAEFLKCCPGTGTWLIQSETFIRWRTGLEKDRQVLWCPGDPGSGKTVMTSIIVDFLTRSCVPNTVALAYIYGDYKSTRLQTSTELLACLAKQLAASRSQPTKDLFNLASMFQGESRRPSLQQSKSLFQSLCEEFSRVYLVVDAVDEIPKSARQTFLSALLDTESPRTSLLFTSRPNCDDIQKQLKNAQIVPIRAMDADVRRYIDQRVNEDENFKGRIGDFLAHLTDTVASSAAGMFLLVVLQLDKLTSLRTASKIQQWLRRLPNKFEDKLSKLYDESIERIKLQASDDSTLGMNILQWLAHAKMPMTVDELRHALAIEWNEGEDLPIDIDRQNILDRSDLKDVCAGLITIEEHSSIIRLVHFTLQEYLNERLEILFPHAEINISRTCLTYLSFSEFARGHTKSDQDYENRLSQYPFLQYASCSFGLHLRGSPERNLEMQALGLLRSRMRLAVIYQVIHTGLSNASYKGYSQDFPQGMTCLHVTSALGLAYLNFRLLEDGENPEQKDSSGRTGLHFACREGHLQLIRQMRGAGIETRDNFRESALHQAIQNNQKASVDLLLRLNAGIESVDGGYSALHLACRYDCEDMVDLFLKEGANTETKTAWSTTALHIAAETGHEGCVKRLLDRGSNVNVQDKNGHTPLHLAAREGFPGVVQTLLNNGAVQQSFNNKGMSPLHLAVHKGYSETTDTLLFNGANVDEKDSSGMTALHYAALNGTQGLVKRLIQHGFSIMEPDHSGRTVLDYADLWHVMEEILQSKVPQKVSLRTIVKHFPEIGCQELAGVLIDKSSSAVHSIEDNATQNLLNVHAQGFRRPERLGELESPLHYAAWTANLALVQSLIDQGVDVNIEGVSQSTALHRASARGHSSVMDLLLVKGADAQCKTTGGKTALGYAAVNGHLDAMQVLIEKTPVDVNSDFGGWTALHGAAKQGHFAAIQLLIHAGANCQARDSSGKTPLHWAAMNGHLMACRTLLNGCLDIDLNALDVTHKTPLHYAVMAGSRAIVELCLSGGANKFIQDSGGFDARRHADIRPNRDLARLLL